MGIRDFSKDMFRIGLKDSYSYIVSIAFTTMIVLLCVNITANEFLYDSNVKDTITQYKRPAPTPEMEVTAVYKAGVAVEVPIKDLQNEMMLVAVIIIACFTFIASRTFVKKRTKELAFIVMNGANTMEMSYYLRYTCSRVFVLGGFIGMILGVITIPIFNLIMYKLIGVQGNVFLYTLDPFMTGIGFLVVNYMFLMISSTSGIYRKEIIEVINDVNTKKGSDTREFKFPSIVYLIIYLIPFGIVFLSKKHGDISGFITIGVYVSILASIGVILLYIPKNIKFINGLKFMDDKKRKIYINNSFMKFKDSVIYIVGTGFTINYFISKIVEFKSHKGLIVTGTLSMILCSLIISVALISKILDDAGINKKFYKILSAMGYTVDELKEISGLEIITTIIGITVVTFLPILFALIMHFRNGSLESSLIFMISGIILLPIIFCGVVGYFINKKRVNIFLEVEIENKKSVLDENTKKIFSFTDKISDFVINGFENLKKLWEKEIF